MTLSVKEKVLQVSVQLLGEEGLGGLSMREVARRAGISHQAPYHYFRDRAAILAELVERGFTMLAERMEAASEHGTPLERLEGAGRAYVNLALEQPVYFRLMFRPELTDHGRFPSTTEAGARAFNVLEALVEKHADAELPAAQRHALVSMHWALVHGLSVLLLDGQLGAKLSSSAQRRSHAELVLRLFVSQFERGGADAPDGKPSAKARARASSKPRAKAGAARSA
jgi:AcrR family transcriptional regulator